MLSTWLKTLECLRSVKGYRKISQNSFVARQGGHQSDMFRVAWSSSTSVSLQDYHSAFLQSPLFQIELFILSSVGLKSWKQTTQSAHLDRVARGSEQNVGPWTLQSVEGDPALNLTVETPSGTCVTKIMQSRISDEPFCDTWWAIEKSESGEIELVFGTDILRYCKGNWVKYSMAYLFDPFHNLYSRLLLASAKATLIERTKQK